MTTKEQKLTEAENYILNMRRLEKLYQPLMDVFLTTTHKVDIKTSKDLNLMLEHYSQAFGLLALNHGTIQWKVFNIPWMIERVADLQASLTHFLEVAEEESRLQADRRKGL